MRKIAAVAIMIVMLIPALLILPVNDASAGNVKAGKIESGGFVPVTLYFHNKSVLDTRAPETNNSTIETLASERQGDTNPDIETVEFETAPLDKELLINQTQKFRVAFNITVDVSLSPSGPYDFVKVNLTITIQEDGTKCASAKCTRDKDDKELEVQGTQNHSFPISETLEFDDDWNYNFDDRSEIKVKITPEISREKGYDGHIAYDVYMEYDHEDKLGVLSNVYCAPVEIDLDTYDKNNQPKTEFMPNLAAEDCIIKFKGSVEDAFGYDDVNSVSIKITGTNVHTSSEDITGNVKNETESLYEWDYSDYSTDFVADELYTATITVETIQHTFYQTTSFTFDAYGLEAKIDDENSASETITAGNQTDYTTNIRNTGSSHESTDVNITLAITVSPPGLHEWNITLADKSIETNTTGSFMYEFFNFQGGDTKSLMLTVKSLSVTGDVGDDWDCSIKITIKFVGTPEIKDLFSTTHLAPPHKIDINWSKTPDDPCYVLVDVSFSLYIDVTNMGSLPDTVNLTLSYTNDAVWDITFKNGWENTTTEKLNPYRYTLDGYEEEVELIIIAFSEGENEATTSVNITACSQGNKSVRDYLTLNLSRAFGISSFNLVSPDIESVDVKVGDGQATYTLKLETNDNTTHTVKLDAVPDNKNITITIPESVDVSKDSPKNVTLTVTCPKGMLAGDYHIMITASITQNDVVVSGHSETVNVTVTVNPYNLLSIKWADTNKDEITVTGKPGEYVNKDLTVVNNGNSKIDNVNIMPSMDDSGLFDSVTPSQPSLLPGEEKTVIVSLHLPADARNGDTFSVTIEASYGTVSDDATTIIKAEQSGWETLMNTLYSMIYFIILLIAVIVAFVALWVKRRKIR